MFVFSSAILTSDGATTSSDFTPKEPGTLGDGVPELQINMLGLSTKAIPLYRSDISIIGHVRINKTEMRILEFTKRSGEE